MNIITQPANIKMTGSLNITIRYNKRYAKQMQERLNFAQKVVDNEVIRQMTPYVPMKTGTLAKSALLNSVIGSGTITYATPYARYLYYGIKYAPNIPIIKEGVLVGFFSPPKKNPTSIPLNYDKSFHPLAGAYWFERMKADKSNEILKAAQDAAGGITV
jgi:hypothetical protein